MTRVFEKWMDRLLLEDPYQGFPQESYAPDLQGWGYRHPVFKTAMELLNPKVIVEVGSWKGMSAIQMAMECKALDLDACIICVDTWLGSSEHIRDPKRNRWTPSLKLKWGYPTLYYTFLSNVMSKGCEDVVLPFPATSDNAAIVLKRSGVMADIIYIDAAHEYELVLRDLEQYWDMLAPGGLLIGDDYLGWEGVTKAADEFAATKQMELVGGRAKFVVSKGPMPRQVRDLFVTLNEKQRLREENLAKAEVA